MFQEMVLTWLKSTFLCTLKMLVKIYAAVKDEVSFNPMHI